MTAVVPSLRVDVLGARAFGVSRSYFAKGIAAGSVSVAGKRAGHAATLAVGDEVQARALGAFKLVSVDGTTRRGNHKVSLSVQLDLKQ
ncbi:MAG: hypothetical protein KF813_10120 [Trueperaceae bacterium]|nr:hypothetical protein [Trueperaceae bacterium]